MIHILNVYLIEYTFKKSNTFNEETPPCICKTLDLRPFTSLVAHSALEKNKISTMLKKTENNSVK